MWFTCSARVLLAAVSKTLPKPSDWRRLGIVIPFLPSQNQFLHDSQHNALPPPPPPSISPSRGCCCMVPGGTLSLMRCTKLCALLTWSEPHKPKLSSSFFPAVLTKDRKFWKLERRISSTVHVFNSGWVLFLRLLMFQGLILLILSTAV